MEAQESKRSEDDANSNANANAAGSTSTNTSNPDFNNCSAEVKTSSNDMQELHEAVNDKISLLDRAFRRNRRCYQFLLRWPRLAAIFVGVTLPIFFLIFLSIIFGIGLAYAEGPLELQQNDASLVESSIELASLSSVLKVTEIAPSLCLNLFIDKQNSSAIERYLRTQILNNSSSNISTILAATEGSTSGRTHNYMAVNTSELFAFMNECGVAAAPLVEHLLANFNSAFIDGVYGELTFNWIRCFPGGDGLGGSPATLASVQSIDVFRFNAQYEWYVKTWKQSQQEYYNASLINSMAAIESNNTNMTWADAKVQAWNESLYLATGGSSCELNVPASAWFWFTILSTVGYGNQAPATVAGRTMVYTLGFFSILAFAGVLSTAGYIATAIADDALVRLRLRSVTYPPVACVVWGLLYYWWMGVIAAATTQYKQARVGDESFGMNSGYWFSYISSTTVGLGDIFLEPEVFLYLDLVSFPLLFLVGFVLVAIFLGKFGETWLLCFGKRTLVSDILAKLNTTDMLKDHPSAGMIIYNRIKERRHRRKQEGATNNSDVQCISTEDKSDGEQQLA